jgi:hypothetical protein
MAVTAVVATSNTNQIDATRTHFILEGTLTLTGTYVSGGFAVQALLAALVQQTSGKPSTIDIYSATGSGFVYNYVESTGKVVILVQGAAATDPLAELAAGALPAGVTADTLRFVSRWSKL